MKIFIALFFIIIITHSFVYAGTSATQLVTYEVRPISEISVSGNPQPLIIWKAEAGSEPVEVTDSSTSYSITSNSHNSKITGMINENMPASTELLCTLQAPDEGQSQSQVKLINTPKELVSLINKKNISNLTITYIFRAQVDAGQIESQQKIITFTIINN
jgi:hypothetical protein